jgi:hypothetical protein
MTTTQVTYQRLVALVHGDEELIVRCLEEGVFEQREGDRVVIDIDRLLVARTLWRDLDIDWPGIDVILRFATSSPARSCASPSSRRSARAAVAERARGAPATSARPAWLATLAGLRRAWRRLLARPLRGRRAA